MSKSNPASWEALEEEVQLEDATGEIAELVLLNDEVNTFDWVIECLVDICRHTFEQAEQLSLLVHFKGRAVVMTAGYDVLKPMKDALCERGLSAIIETIPV